MNQESAFFRTGALLLMMFAASVLSVLIYGLIIGGTPSSVVEIRCLQVLQSLLVFALPPVLLAKLCHQPVKGFLSLTRPHWHQVLVSVLSVVAFIPLVNLSMACNKAMVLPSWLAGVEQWMQQREAAASALTETLLSQTHWTDVLWNVLIIAVLAGVTEECLFRSCLRECFRWAISRPSLSIWLSAMVFSAFHLQFYGFLPRLLLGAWFGYLLWWTNSVWVPIAAHIANNLLALMTDLASRKQWLPAGFSDRIGLDTTRWLLPISLVLLAACVVYFRRIGQARDHNCSH